MFSTVVRLFPVYFGLPSCPIVSVHDLITLKSFLRLAHPHLVTLDAIHERPLTIRAVSELYFKVLSIGMLLSTRAPHKILSIAA